MDIFMSCKVKRKGKGERETRKQPVELLLPGKTVTVEVTSPKLFGLCSPLFFHFAVGRRTLFFYQRYTQP
jgi:hypothetical protein